LPLPPLSSLKQSRIGFFSWKTWLVLAGIIISLFFFFTTVVEARNSQFFSASYNWLSKTFGLENKDLTASRPIYFSQGWQSFKESRFSALAQVILAISQNNFKKILMTGPILHIVYYRKFYLRMGDWLLKPFYFLFSLFFCKRLKKIAGRATCFCIC